MFQGVQSVVKSEIDDEELNLHEEVPTKKFRFAELILKEEFVDEVNGDGLSKNIFDNSTEDFQSNEKDCLALDVPSEKPGELAIKNTVPLEEKILVKATRLAGPPNTKNALVGNKFLILTQGPTTSSGSSKGTHFAQPFLINFGMCGQNINNKKVFQAVPEINKQIIVQKKPEIRIINEPEVKIEDPIHVEKSTYDQDLLTFLQNDANGKGILTVYKNKKNNLPPSARKSLVHILIQREKDEVLRNREPGDILPDWDIPSTRWRKLAKEIEETFPSELKEVYYSAFTVVNGVKVLASGKLLDHFYYVKRVMRDQGVLAQNARRRKQEEIEKINLPLDESQESDLEFLATQTEPFEELIEVFNRTRILRKHITLVKNMNICEYLLSIKALRLNEEGQALIHLDFDAQHPGKKSKLTEKWPKIKEYLADVIRWEAKPNSQEDTNNIFRLKTQNPEQQDIIIFYLLHYITTKVHGKKKIKNENEEIDFDVLRKLSADEKRRSYLIHVANDDDLNTTLAVLKDSLKAQNSKPKPIIAIVGTLLDIQKYYVIMGDIKYSPNSFIDAIDLNFKMFQVFDCEYPAFSFGVWRFIQSIIYEIITPGEKLTMQHKLLSGQIQRLCKS